MPFRNDHTSDPTTLKPGDVEYEMGYPIPGELLPKEKWVQTALKKLPENESLRFNNLFGRVAPIVLDIGCGNGRFAISSAVRRPDLDHIAIDILPAVIRYGTRRGNQRGLSNLRFAVCDGWRFLNKWVPQSSIAEIHIYHPQPYADPQNADRRMLTPDFLVLAHDRLVESGQLFLQTDRKAYWDYLSSVVPRLFDWEERDEPWAEDPNGRSRREMISRDQGLTIYRGIATRRSKWTLETIKSAAGELPLPDFVVEDSQRSGSNRNSHHRRKGGLRKGSGSANGKIKRRRP